ncbi:MAG: efflux RND transporter permease subunit [Myxococcota bacterium]
MWLPDLPLDPRGVAAGVAVLLVLGLWVVARRPAWIVDRPRSVLGLLALVSAVALATLVRPEPPGLRLRIDPSTESLLPTGDPATETYRRAVRDFGDDQVYVIAMETEDVFRAEHLEALRRVTDAVSRLEGVRSVKSLLRVTSFRYVAEDDWIEVRPFIEDVPRDPAELDRLRARATGDPLYRKVLVSEDGRAAAVNVSFRKMSDGDFIEADLDGRVRAILAAETVPGRRFHVSGRPHIKSVMYHAMLRDLRVLIPVGVALVAGVLALLSHSVRGVVLPLATVGASILWTFAGMAALDRALSVLSVLLAPTLLAVGSVYGVHVVNRYEEEAPAAASAREAAAAVLREMRAPVLIAGVTTAVGFAALLVTDVPAVFEIGAFSVLGVASVTLLSLTGIPAALVLLPRRATPRASPLARVGGRVLERTLAGLAGTACRRPGAVIGGFALLLVLALAAIPRIEVDTDYLSFFDPDAPVRRDFERVNRLLAGAVPLFVVFDGGERGHLREPDVLRRIEAVQQDLDALPGVSRTLSFLDTLRVLNRAVSGDDPAAERIPDTRAGVTELFFMLPKSDLQRFATIDQSAANLVVRTGEVGSAALRALSARIEAVLAERPVPGLRAGLTGNAILLTRAADGVARAQPRTVLLAAAAIFLLLATSLRSLPLGAIAMIPNAVPVLIFFGVLGAGVAPLSLPTSLIGSVALGIAIDATAHYLVRYREERRAGADPRAAVLRCNLRVGRPIAVASLMLIAGFASVGASGFATLREFGQLSALTMAVCALTDLLLLPAILVRARV